MHEETGLQGNGTRSSLAANPDSISAVMTIVFVCGDPVVITSALQQHTAPTVGVMVWGAIAYNTRLPGFIFQQDNVRPHSARVSQDCLYTVTALFWPTRSSDLSPIENI
ncbi:transposable element Tcb2 transposase [Trichonephila clavipes]|nr:transposable element Tcb2 transposase [Trichonephila clavipes]